MCAASGEQTPRATGVANLTTWSGSAAVVWSLMVSFITMRDAIILTTMSTPDTMPARKITCGIDFVLWVITAFASTIDGPFANGGADGNGYFSVMCGLFVASQLALEEFRQELPRYMHVRYALLYLASGVVLLLESFPEVGKYCSIQGLPDGTSLPDGSSTCTFAIMMSMPVSYGLPNWALAYGLINTLFGLLILLVLLSLRYEKLKRLRPLYECFSSEIQVRGRSGLTGLRALAGVLLVVALTSALILTNNFQPYSEIGNAYIACWVSVLSAGMLLSEERQAGASTEQLQSVVVEGGGSSVDPDAAATTADLLGRRVKIDGLASKPELNGTFGTAISFDDVKGRYNVKLEATAEMMALKPANVSKAAGGGGGGSGAAMPTAMPYAVSLLVSSVLVIISVSGDVWDTAALAGTVGTCVFASVNDCHTPCVSCHAFAGAG